MFDTETGKPFLTDIHPESYDYDRMLQKAILFVDDEVDFTQYNHLNIVAPMGLDGGFYNGFSNGVTSVTTDDGTAILTLQYYRSHRMAGAQAYIHEMGHGMGLGHASSEYHEYGDIFDVMGTVYWYGHFNAIHKEMLGWFDEGQVLEVKQTGIYELEPYKTPSPGRKVLKIPRRGEYMYVEYRRPTGFDAWLPYECVAFHLQQNIHDYGDTLLFYPNATPALIEGESFVDDVGNYSIEVLSTTSDALTVKIDFEESPPYADAGEDKNVLTGQWVDFTGSGFDPDGGNVTFEWDLDGDGVFDSFEESPSYIYDEAGAYTVTLKVTDDELEETLDTATVRVIKESLITNHGSVDISAYLLVKVLKKENGRFQDLCTVIEDDSLITVPAETSVSLHALWEDAGGFIPPYPGRYRVYAALLDKKRNTIRTPDGELEGSAEFDVIIPGWDVEYRNRLPGDIAIDSNGNIYIAGSRFDTPQMDVLKFDRTGRLLWERIYNIPGTAYGVAKGITVDSLDHVYMVGGAYNASSVFKLDPDGNILWHKDIEKISYGAPYSIFVDFHGDVIVNGSRTHTGSDPWIVKLDADGNVLWDKCSDLFGKYLVLDEDGNIYTLQSTGSHQRYRTRVAKFDTNADLIWEKLYDGSMYSSSIAYGQGCLVIGAKNYDTRRYPVMRIDPANGEIIWEQDENSYIMDISVDSAGLIHLGSFYSVKILEPENGARLWEKQFFSDFTASIDKIAVNEKDNMLFVVGSRFSGDIGYLKFIGEPLLLE